MLGGIVTCKSTNTRLIRQNRSHHAKLCLRWAKEASCWSYMNNGSSSSFGHMQQCYFCAFDDTQCIDIKDLFFHFIIQGRKHWIGVVSDTCIKQCILKWANWLVLYALARSVIHHTSTPPNSFSANWNRFLLSLYLVTSVRMKAATRLPALCIMYTLIICTA